MPLGVAPLSWASARISANIVGILLNEIIGVNTVLNPEVSSSMNGFRTVSGCTDVKNSAADFGCGARVSEAHVVLEAWSTSVSGVSLDYMRNLLDEKFPEDLGSVGYDGYEALYVPVAPKVAALNAEGLALEFYRSLNRSWHDPAQYFSRYSDLNTTDLLECSATRGYSGTLMEKYVNITGDTAGVETVGGKTVWKCYGGATGHWWFSPACRAAPNTCIPVITGGDGWSLDAFMQRAATFNVPLAITVGKSPKYKSAPKEITMMFYWWTPDIAHIDLLPVDVKFPDYDKAGWAVGNKLTDATKVTLRKWVHFLLKEANSRARDLVSNFAISGSQMDAMLFEFKTSTGKTEFDLACEWLKANPKFWTAWVPLETNCAAGWGMRNSAGDFVQNRSLATSCYWCPPGRYSAPYEDARGKSNVCLKCPAGQHQPSPAQTMCILCEPGTFSSTEGTSGDSCTTCPIGTYSSATGMTGCSQCGGGAPWWTTMRPIMHRGEQRWVQTDGAKNETACGCDEGARFDSQGRCVECELEGIECQGMGNVYVLPGFYSAAELDVFRCAAPLRCPGGTPGMTCAYGRESISCARCTDGMRGGQDGGCIPCTGGDSAPFAMMVVLIVLAFFGVYFVFERNKQSQPSHAVLLAGISGGLLVGLMQQISVLGMLDISYMEPLASFLSICRVFAFDIESFVHLSCIGSFPPLAHFISKISLIVGAVALLCLVHVLFVLIRHKGAFRERNPVLIALIGTLTMVFYISVTVTVLQPFQCTANPNGKWTNSEYEDVLCWTGEGDHTPMVVIAVIAIFFPLALFTKVATLVRAYPRAVRRGDIRFLRSFGFLFFRFRPQCHWYILVVMTRSLWVGIVPVVPRSTVQIFLLKMALLATFGTTIHYRPWRVDKLNNMDTFFGAVMLLFLTLASFLVSEPNGEVLGWICVVMVLFSVALIPGIIIYAALKRFGTVPKHYQFFLCHAKVEAGAFARWLKMELLAHPSVTRDVFLDADNLESLDLLLSYVAVDLQTLCVCCTKSLFFRPWCVGEVTTAMLNNIDVEMLSLPGYERLTEDTIATFDTQVQDLECLYDNGIRIEDIKKALQMFSEKPSIQVFDTIGTQSMDKLVNMIAMYQRSGTTEIVQQVSTTAVNIIVVDNSNFEANASAHVLQRLLVPHTCHDASLIPEVLPVGVDLPLSAERVLVVCTTGCFDDPAYISKILTAWDRGLQTLPVIADAEFRVPSKKEVAKIPAGKLSHDPSGRERSTKEVVTIIASLFKEIAVSINPKHASATVLAVGGSRAGARLVSKKASQISAGRNSAPQDVFVGSSVESDKGAQKAVNGQARTEETKGTLLGSSDCSQNIYTMDSDDENEKEDEESPGKLRVTSKWRGAGFDSAEAFQFDRSAFALEVVTSIAMSSGGVEEQSP